MLARAWILVGLLLFALPSGAMPYPYLSPYLATLTFASLKARNSDLGELHYLLVNPSREDLPYLPNAGNLPLVLYRQKHAAPLMFVIPGLGGHPKQASTSYLAEIIYAHGYHVVTMPSSMNWSFVSSLSSKGPSGLPKEDASDMYEGMKKVFTFLTKEVGIQVTFTEALGYSLGALTLGHVANFNSEDNERNFDLQKILLLNPPGNLAKAMITLDEMYELGSDWTPQMIQELTTHAFTVLYSRIQGNIDSPDYFLGLQKQLRLTPNAIKYLIGSTFRESLKDVLFAADITYDLKTFQSELSWGSREARYAEIRKYGFRRTFETFLLPRLQPHADKKLTLDDIDREENIFAALDANKGRKRFVVFHNQDDLFITDADWSRFKALGDRAKLFEHGGHLGNVWHSDYQEALIEELDQTEGL